MGVYTYFNCAVYTRNLSRIACQIQIPKLIIPDRRDNHPNCKSINAYIYMIRDVSPPPKKTGKNYGLF